VSGIWSVVMALVVASVFLVLTNLRRLPKLRKTLDAGATGATRPVFNVASMAGFGAVVAAFPAFAAVRDGLLAIPGGPLVSMTVAASVMGVITASASAALSITLDALGETYARLAAEAGIDPSLMHRVASLACGPPSMLPHSGAIVTLLTICGTTQRKSFRHIAMVTLVGPLLALIVVIVLGQTFGSF
jgi:H+/gluconate symporter-like permease